jgi:hypothetical protein
MGSGPVLRASSEKQFSSHVEHLKVQVVGVHGVCLPLTADRRVSASAALVFALPARAQPGELVTAALLWRLAPPGDTDAAATLLGRALIPLNLHYVDDHIALL